MLLLITTLLMVLLLSGCRTRISNNTEVASTISDDDGWLQETYQMRRDELGMPVAKKPFITGTGEEEDIEGYDEDFDRAMEDLDDYINNPEEDDFYDTDGDRDDNRSSSQNVSSSRPSSRRSPTVRRRTGTTTRRKTTPTKKNNSTNTNTNTETNQEQQEQPKKQFTVSFDGNGVDMDGATITVEEGGKYGSLPTPPSRDDYTFDGWFTEKDGGSKVKEGDEYTSDGDQTLYAHWTQKDPEEIWGNRFEVAANEQEDKLDCLLQGDASMSRMEKLVGECKGNSVTAENSPKCIIVFASNPDDISDEEAQRLFDENSVDAEGNPTVLEKVIIISDDSISGSDREKLFYKFVLLDAMHGKVGQDTLDAVGSDLGISEYSLGIYTKP